MTTIICEVEHHCSALAHSLLPYFERSELVDFCIEVHSHDGSTPVSLHHVHRIVVAAACPVRPYRVCGFFHPKIPTCFAYVQYFASLFSSSLHENHLKSVRLELPAHLVPCFGAIVRYFYTGSAAVLESDVVSLLALADMFSLESLARVCASKLVRHITPANCFTMLHLADSFPSAGEILREPCFEMALDHFAIQARGSFSFLSANLISELLRSNNLRIPSELQAVLLAFDWFSSCPPGRVLPSPSSAQHDVDACVDTVANRSLVLSSLRYSCVKPADWFVISRHSLWPRVFPSLRDSILDQLSSPKLPVRRVHYAGALRLSQCKTPVHVIRDHSAAISAMIVVGAEQDIMISGSYDKSVCVFRLSDFSRLQTVNDHTGAIYCIAAGEDGRTVYTGSADTTIGVFSCNTDVPGPNVLKLESRLAGHTLAVLTIIVLPNQMIASGSMDRTVRIWDPSQKENHCISILNGHRDAVRALCLIGESKQWLCSGGYDKRILVWDWKNGQMLREIVTSGTVHSLSLMDHARVLASTHDGAIRIWHIRLVNDSVQSDCERVVENTHGALPGTEAAWATLVCGDTSSDHREIQNVISAGLDKRVRVWNVVSALSHSQQANVLSLRADRSLCGHTGGVLSLAFSEVHQVLFSGSQDSTIAVWR